MIAKYVNEGRLDASQVIPDPEYRASPLDFLIMTCPRSRSTHLISVLRTLGFGAEGELLAPEQAHYPAAVYYFRNETAKKGYFELSMEDTQAALSAMFSHGFLGRRDPRSEFFGFKVFPGHISEGSFHSFIAGSSIVGTYPLKVIHLIRRESFMLALSFLEAHKTKVFAAFSPEESQRGALLTFKDEEIASLATRSLRFCLFNLFYESDLALAEEEGLIQLLTIDSSDIDTSSPNFDSTLETIRQFLLKDVHVPQNKAFQNRNTPIQELVGINSEKHIRARSSLPLQERIPEPLKIYQRVSKLIKRIEPTEKRYPEHAYQECKGLILSEINMLVSESKLN